MSQDEHNPRNHPESPLGLVPGVDYPAPTGQLDADPATWPLEIARRPEVWEQQLKRIHL